VEREANPFIRREEGNRIGTGEWESIRENQASRAASDATKTLDTGGVS
jgi:hypothetical protein